LLLHRIADVAACLLAAANKSQERNVITVLRCEEMFAVIFIIESSFGFCLPRTLCHVKIVVQFTSSITLRLHNKPASQPATKHNKFIPAKSF